MAVGLSIIIIILTMSITLYKMTYTTVPEPTCNPFWPSEGQAENYPLIVNTMTNTSCETVERYIELDFFPSTFIQYDTSHTNLCTSIIGFGTGENTEKAKNRWMNYYLSNCVKEVSK